MIFKKKRDTIQSNRDGKLRHFETVKRLILFIQQKTDVLPMHNSKHGHYKNPLNIIKHGFISVFTKSGFPSERLEYCCAVGSLQRKQGSSQLWRQSVTVGGISLLSQVPRLYQQCRFSDKMRKPKSVVREALP